MAPWLQLAAFIVPFLLGGISLSELICRRVDARHAKQWADDHPADNSVFTSK